jgi:hypothetical protein
MSALNNPEERDRLRQQAAALEQAQAPQPSMAAPTMGMPAGGGPALQGAPPAANGALSSPPAGQAVAGTPPVLPQTAAPQAGGAAPPQQGKTIQQYMEEQDPDTVIDTMEQSVKAVQATAEKSPEVIQQVNTESEKAGITVVGLKEDFEQQFYDSLKARRDASKPPKYSETEWKKRWKNIYNIIPEDQMPLFLMDFGLRMLAASGSGQGDVFSDIGMAGSGALAGLQERQAAEQQQITEDSKAATEYATTMTDLTMKEKEANQITEDKLVVGEDGVALYDSGDGMGLQPVTVNGKALKIDPAMRRGRAGNQYAVEIQKQMLESVGYTEREAVDMINGAPTDAEIRFKFGQKFQDGVNAGTREAPPGGSRAKAYKDWTKEERRQWVEDRVAETKGTAGVPVVAEKPKRPPGFDNY